MTIREKVARAIERENLGEGGPSRANDMATAAITAFLEAAAERGWQLMPTRATEEMDEAGLDDPKSGYCDRCMHMGHTRNSGWPSVIYDAMRAAAPEFEVDG